MSKKIQSYLGVDLGGGGIKMVELANEGGRARLLTYGFTNEEPLGGDWLSDKKKTAVLIKKIYTKAGINARQATTALPAHLVFSSVVTLPKPAKEDEFRASVEAEVKKLTGQEPADQVIDWQLIEEIKNGEKSRTLTEDSVKVWDKSGFRKILLTAAPKNLVTSYTEVFALAGLKLQSLETESFAWVRSLIGKDQATILIIDMGSERTNSLIVSNGLPQILRSMKGGGDNITLEITKALGISEDQAERLKKDASFAGQSIWPQIFNNALTPLVKEIKYFLENYLSQNEGVKQVDRIILTGGSANLSGLAEFLSKTFNLRVFVGDPWSRVLYSDSLRPVLDEIGSRFAGAVGLALREIEK